MKSLRLFLAAVLLLLPLSHLAAKEKEPDPSTNPALAALVNSGAKFYYMGRFANLDGWMAVKDDQMQLIYKPTNNAYAFVGYLFGPAGDNVTADQLKKLTANNKELAGLALASDTTSNMMTDGKPLTPEQKAEIDEIMMPSGKKLLRDVRKIFSVTLAAKEAKEETTPLIVVFVTPNCQDCKAFWQKVHDDVMQGRLILRLYPAGIKDSDDERASAQLLDSPDPMTAWDKFESGDAGVLAGAAKLGTIGKIQANADFIIKWRFPAAPYLVYNGKDGVVKVVQGVPTDIKALIDDAAPEKLPESRP